MGRWRKGFHKETACRQLNTIFEYDINRKSRSGEFTTPAFD